jgi:hypothetical protein
MMISGTAEPHPRGYNATLLLIYMRVIKKTTFRSSQ